MVEDAGPSRAERSAILLVDDNEALLAALQRILSSETTLVVTENTGAHALLRLAERPFDVIVSDIRMPGMSGLKLLKSVREYDLDLPVVLITGSPDARTAAEAIQYGALQYLVKPVPAEQLRAVVERAITLGRIARLKRHGADEFGSGSFYVGDRAAVDAKLDRALQSARMKYEPIVNISDGKVRAYQALLCSDEPALQDADGIARAAMRVKRLHEVGRVARRLMSEEAQRQSQGKAAFFLKLDPEDLLDSTLYSADDPLAPIASRVVVEFSDRALLDSVKDVNERIGLLRDRGFRIAIGEFGAGHSGASTFAQIGPAFVKVDVSLVRQLDSSPGKRNLVRSLVELCHQLSQSVVAEGVSSLGELNTLRELGCDMAGGELFSDLAPMAGNKVTQYLPH